MPIEQLIHRITISLQEILKRLLGSIPKDDFVRLIINNSYLQNPINMSFVQRQHLTLVRVLEILTSLLNLNDNFLIDGTLEVNIIYVQNSQGGRSRKACESFAAKVQRSKAIVEIKNKDNMCLARAIVVGKAKADKHR